jgi:hypothetical protein
MFAGVVVSDRHEPVIDRDNDTDVSRYKRRSGISSSIERPDGQIRLISFVVAQGLNVEIRHFREFEFFYQIDRSVTVLGARTGRPLPKQSAESFWRCEARLQADANDIGLCRQVRRRRRRA